MRRELNLRTSERCQWLDITGQVNDAIAESGVQEGICVIYSPHTTAGITINENADPDVVHDVLRFLDRTVPRSQPGFRHAEGNSDSHIKTSLVGTSATVIIHRGRAALGTWQGIFFCEFDGPRQRRCWLQILAGVSSSD